MTNVYEFKVKIDGVIFHTFIDIVEKTIHSIFAGGDDFTEFFKNQNHNDMLLDLLNEEINAMREEHQSNGHSLITNEEKLAIKNILEIASLFS